MWEALLWVVAGRHMYNVERSNHCVMRVVHSGLYSSCLCLIRTQHINEVWDDERCKSVSSKEYLMLQGISSTKVACMVVFWEEGPEAQKTVSQSWGGYLAHQIFTNSSSTYSVSLFAKYPNCSISSRDSLSQNFENTCALMKWFLVTARSNKM